MSTFSVSIERIAAIWEHPNADRLELARLASMSYQFVIGKGAYKVGDLVVYFPVDSLLPEQIVNVAGLTGKLAGPDKNRVKTIRLRGVISQGIVILPGEVISEWDNGQNFHEGQDVTELLGVTKYEPPLLVGQEGALGRMPPLVSIYDIEGAERFVAETDRYFMDKSVLITEKLEGSHFSVSLYANNDMIVCRRRYSVTADHAWYKVAERDGVLAKLPDLKQAIDDGLGRITEVVTVRGEIVGPGIQANHYKLPQITLFVFEIEADGEPVNIQTYLALVEKFEIAHAPVLAANETLRQWLAGRSLAEASNGQSMLNPAAPREGIVIRPAEELRDERLGRVIIKQRSPEYLVGSDF
jgi:RNA ligase (TIGR02306 family)